MKNVTLIGASGFVGTAILNELLARGHRVTAVVRNPGKIGIKSPSLTAVQADVTDTSALVAACKGRDAVISAYNPGWTNPNIYEETLRNYPLILEAVRQSGVRRLLCVGGAGTLFCAPGLRVVGEAQEVVGGHVVVGTDQGYFFWSGGDDPVFQNADLTFFNAQKECKIRLSFVVIHTDFFQTLAKNFL